MNKNSHTASRSKIIVRTSIIGILANIVLAGFKAFIGVITHSIAIVMDGVNNLTDAASSVVTIIGTKLADKEPNKKHPFGHKRVEYLSAMIVAVIVLYAGVTSLIESVKKIIEPQTPDYTPVLLIIIGVAVVVKILLGIYVKGIGKKVNSDSLINSGEDARLDAIISASTIVAAIIYMTTGLSLEAYLGVIISLVIIKSGIEMLKETVSKILGEPADMELAESIKKTVLSFPDVEGAYDLVLNNYGPDTFNGSIHIEVPDTYNADELDELIRAITNKVYKEHNVALTAIGVYSLNTKDPEAIEARRKVLEIAMASPYIMQVHGFNMNPAEKTMRFDLVVSFDAESREKVFTDVVGEIQAEFPDYTLSPVMDTEFTAVM